MELGALRLTEIAYEVKRGGEMPDYLSESEKETVKEALKYLYAADKAMRVYIIKTQFLDNLKLAQQKLYDLEQTRLKWARITERTTEYIRRPVWDNLKRSAANLASLTERQRRAALALDGMITDLSRDFIKMLRKRGVDISANEVKRFTEAQATIDVNRFSIAERLGDKHASADLRIGRFVREHLLKWFDNQSTGLGEVVRGYYKRFDAYNELLGRAFGVLSQNTKDAMKVAMDRGAAANMEATKNYAAAMKDAVNQVNETEKIGKATIAMAQYYIVAAMGEALQDLALQLRC